MSTVIVLKGNDGRLEGLGDKGRRMYLKLKRTIAAMAIGEMMCLSFKLPRSPKHHNFFFLKITGLFDRQEQFSDFERFRGWLTVGAGYCDLMPGPGGLSVALPQSLAFENMDEAEFVDLHQKINAFLWGEHAQQFLWPHLDYDHTYEAIERWHMEFEHGRP